jgi:hypothetical protein
VDTRGKIVEPGAAAEAARERRRQGGEVAVATGWFALLDRATVRELASAKGGALLIAVVMTEPETALDARARAEMAAAVDVIDYVVIAGSGMPVERLLAVLEPHAVVRCEAAHRERMRRFIDHVHRRHEDGVQ